MFLFAQNYNHRLVCHDLKGAWTLTNRKIAFGLFEAYTNAQVNNNNNNNNNNNSKLVGR